MHLQVLHQRFHLAIRKLEFLDADELRPAEAVSAVRVTRLARRREKQQSLTVLVLHTGQGLAVQFRYVQLHLARRMRVQSALDFPSSGLDRLFGRLTSYEAIHPAEILTAQHRRLRKCELKHGILGDVRPIDQLLDDVVVDSEGQYRRHRLHGIEVARRKSLELGDLIEVTPRAHLESSRVWLVSRDVAALQRQ